MRKYLNVSALKLQFFLFPQTKILTYLIHMNENTLCNGRKCGTTGRSSTVAHLHRSDYHPTGRDSG